MLRPPAIGIPDALPNNINDRFAKGMSMSHCQSTEGIERAKTSVNHEKRRIRRIHKLSLSDRASKTYTNLSETPIVVLLKTP